MIALAFLVVSVSWLGPAVRAQLAGPDVREYAAWVDSQFRSLRDDIAGIPPHDVRPCCTANAWSAQAELGLRSFLAQTALGATRIMTRGEPRNC